MTEDKVIIEQATLRGSPDGIVGQRVALVYIEGIEYRVVAPPGAKGNAVDWIRQSSVRRLIDINSEEILNGALKNYVLKLVKETIENQKKSALRLQGKHTDELHCTAQICRNGHVQRCDGMPFDSGTHCSQCGAACIDSCPKCEEPIRGRGIYSAANYERPEFCHKCGKPYPWMEDRLDTARDLLYHDEMLTQNDREQFGDLLQYVMSNPKGDLTPAKKRLIEIKLLPKAAAATRQFVIDLLATYGKEMSKPG